MTRRRQAERAGILASLTTRAKDRTWLLRRLVQLAIGLFLLLAVVCLTLTINYLRLSAAYDRLDSRRLAQAQTLARQSDTLRSQSAALDAQGRALNALGDISAALVVLQNPDSTPSQRAAAIQQANAAVTRAQVQRGERGPPGPPGQPGPPGPSATTAPTSTTTTTRPAITVPGVPGLTIPLPTVPRLQGQPARLAFSALEARRPYLWPTFAAAAGAVFGFVAAWELRRRLRRLES